MNKLSRVVVFLAFAVLVVGFVNGQAKELQLPSQFTPNLVEAVLQSHNVTKFLAGPLLIHTTPSAEPINIEWSRNTSEQVRRSEKPPPLWWLIVGWVGVIGGGLLALFFLLLGIAAIHGKMSWRIVPLSACIIFSALVVTSWEKGVQGYLKFYYDNPLDVARKINTPEAYFEYIGSDGSDTVDFTTAAKELKELLAERRGIRIQTSLFEDSPKLQHELSGLRLYFLNFELPLIRLSYLSEARDVSVFLKIEGEKLGAVYKSLLQPDVNPTYRSTGGTCTGRIVLTDTKSNKILVQRQFSETVDPPRSYKSGLSGGEYPLASVFEPLQDRIIDIIVDVFSQGFGTGVKSKVNKDNLFYGRKSEVKKEKAL